MKKISIIMLAIIFFSFALTGCESKSKIKKIKAESYTISYGNNVYKMEKEEIESLVEGYNNIKLEGETSQSIDYDQAINIIFIQSSQISGKITIDDKGVCRVEDRLKNYTISDESNIYNEALNVYQEIARRHKL